MKSLAPSMLSKRKLVYQRGLEEVHHIAVRLGELACCRVLEGALLVGGRKARNCFHSVLERMVDFGEDIAEVDRHFEEAGIGSDSADIVAADLDNNLAAVDFAAAAGSDCPEIEWECCAVLQSSRLWLLPGPKDP